MASGGRKTSESSHAHAGSYSGSNHSRSSSLADAGQSPGLATGGATVAGGAMATNVTGGTSSLLAWGGNVEGSGTVSVAMGGRPQSFAGAPGSSGGQGSAGLAGAIESSAGSGGAAGSSHVGNGLAGSAGVRATLPRPGYYELEVEAWNDPIGYDCGPLYAGTQLILNWQKLGDCDVESVDCYDATFLFGNLDATAFEAQSLELNQGTLSAALNAMQKTEVLSESLLRVDLAVNQGRFNGIGKATLERSCVGREPIRYERTLAVAEDKRGPILTIRNRPYLGSHLVTWAPVELQANEPLANPAAYDCALSTDCMHLFDLGWFDVTSTRPRPGVMVASSRPSVLVRYPDLVAGQKLHVLPASGDAQRDLAGNPLSSWPESIAFVDDQPLAMSLEFESQAPKGVVGPHEWIQQSDATLGPCESRRCLSLGPLQPCLLPQTPIFQSVWFQTGGAKALRLRVAIETDDPKADIVPLIVVGQAAEIPSEGEPDRHAAVVVEELAQAVSFEPKGIPDGIFTHTSSFKTYELPLTLANPLGAAVTLRCGSPFSRASARLLIKSWQLVP